MEMLPTSVSPSSPTLLRLENKADYTTPETSSIDNASSVHPVSRHSVAATAQEDPSPTTANTQRAGSPLGMMERPLFRIDDRCLAPDSQQTYYVGIIRQARHDGMNGGEWMYLVHYKGWNARFDQWVTAAAIVPDTEENRIIYQAQSGPPSTKKTKRKLIPSSSSLTAGSNKRVATATPESTTNGNTAATGTTTTTTDATKSIRTKQSSASTTTMTTITTTTNTTATTAATTNTSATPTTKLAPPSRQRQRVPHNDCYVYTEYCALPFTLKAIVLEEAEIFRKRKPQYVHCLPAVVSVRKILSHFGKKILRQQPQNPQNREETSTWSQNAAITWNGQNSIRDHNECSNHSGQGPFTAETVETFCTKMGRLFEAALPSILLYTQERQQYQSFGDKSRLDIYGCEHLLRFLVHLPCILQMEVHTWTVTTNLVGPLLAKLIIVLQKNCKALVKRRYQTIE